MNATYPVFRPLLEMRAQPELVADVHALIHEAGNPYYDWFYGGSSAARSAIARQFELPASEISARRITLLMSDGRLAALSIALGGDELAQCRRADAVAALATVGRSEAARALLAERIEQSRGLFAAVAADDFYLSKLAVVPELRRHGLGRALVHHYLASGYAARFRRFRLDVSADNVRAVELYRSLGFETIATREAAGLRYTSMSLAPGSELTTQPAS